MARTVKFNRGGSIDVLPYSTTRLTHRRVMERIIGRPLKSTEPVLRIDLDETNHDYANLFLCKSYQTFSQAMKSLHKLATELIKKGFINFSKKTGLYAFSKAFKKLLDKTSCIRPYIKRLIDEENDTKLKEMLTLLSQRNEQINRGTGFIRNNPCLTILKEEPSFTVSRGYKGQMERMISRRLKAEEQVHHIDHDHHNNFDFNLYLCADAQHHSTLHHQLDRLLSLLIKKGFIHFSLKQGLYSFSRQFARIVSQRAISPPYRTSLQRRFATHPSPSLAGIIQGSRVKLS